MTTYIADSDVIIDFFNKHNTVPNNMEQFLRKEKVVISAITFMEVRRGWNPEQTKKMRPILMALFPVIDVTTEIADYAGEQWNRYRSQGMTLSTTDTLIAATAILNHFCLITRNIKDFPMPELNLYRDLQIAK
jgi:predicted nucleic acid-binding protein